MKKTLSALLIGSTISIASFSGVVRCNALKGNDRDVCLERASANLKIAESDIKAYEKNTTAASIKAEKERIKQLHKVDDEKCESYKGNAKDVCEAQADAVKKRREGNLKALESRLEGDYKLAVEKCEALDGDKRSACKDEAKRAYKP
jgi:Tfp pilus assembly protein PilX